MQAGQKKKGSFFIVAGCLLFAGTMFSVPWFFRKNTDSLTNRDKLTGSQRMRGMYMNVGATDMGADPKWQELHQIQRMKEAADLDKIAVANNNASSATGGQVERGN